MAGYTVLSARYAEALLQLAQEKGLTETVYADLNAIKNVYDESADLRAFLKSPVINLHTKKAALEKAFGGKLDKLTLLFIEKLVDARREMYIDEIAKAFNEAYKRMKGVVTAQVITAAPMTDKIRAEVTNIIKNNKEFINASSIEIEEKIDKNIIGGIIINVGDKQMQALAVKSMILKKAFSENLYVKEY